MEDFPVSCLLDKDSLPILVLVAALQVVVEGELDGGGDALTFVGLTNGYVLPFLFSLVFNQIGIHLMQALVDRVGYDRLSLFELSKRLQEVHLNFIVR